MREAVRIRDLAAESGEQRQGFLTIGETVAGPVQIPLVIINGRADGPVLCLTAGVHATEYAPIDAVMRLVQSTCAETLAGALVAVPVANMRMFEARSPFVSPLDGLNLNKLGPCPADGSISQILARVLLEDVICAADYHIDLHAGDLGEMLLPFAGYALTGNAEQDEVGEYLARLYTPRLISLSTPSGTVPPFPDGLSYAASHRGVVSVFGESGGNGTLDPADVQIHMDGVRNVMRYLKMIEGGVEEPGARLAARDRVVVRASRAGLLRLHVAIGDEIRAGQHVADICNVFGDVIERVAAPGEGIAGLVWSHKVVNTGDPIVRYWITEPA
jgi:predicted deacylase